MIDWIVKLLQNYSVYKLGWFSEGFDKVLNHHNGAGWEAMAITVIVGMSILVLTNIIYFIIKADNGYVYWKVYVPLCLLYIVQNIFFHFVLACLFLSLGPVMWIILMTCYALFISVWSGIKADEYEELPGFFKVIMFVVQYSERFKDYKNHREEVTENYQKFLNIKYE